MSESTEERPKMRAQLADYLDELSSIIATNPWPRDGDVRKLEEAAEALRATPSPEATEERERLVGRMVLEVLEEMPTYADDDDFGCEVRQRMKDLDRLMTDPENQPHQFSTPSPERDLTDARAAYMNLRTCFCGEDASAHHCPQRATYNDLTGFDPDWEQVLGDLEGRQIGPSPEREADPLLREAIHVIGLANDIIAGPGDAALVEEFGRRAVDVMDTARLRSSPAPATTPTGEIPERVRRKST